MVFQWFFHGALLLYSFEVGVCYETERELIRSCVSGNFNSHNLLALFWSPPATKNVVYGVVLEFFVVVAVNSFLLVVATMKVNQNSEVVAGQWREAAESGVNCRFITESDPFHIVTLFSDCHLIHFH